MKRGLVYGLLLAGGVLLLARTSHAQCATCPAPVTTFAAPQTQQVFQPVVPSTVVVEQPRRCCLLRFCDWLCGTDPQPVVATVPTMQTVSFAPAATCAPVCAPPCGCNACPTDCGTCPSCNTMAAPALSSRFMPQSTYAAYGATPYAGSSPIQQVNYSGYSSNSNVVYGASTPGQTSQAYYGQATATEPSSSYTYPASGVQRATYQAPSYQAPTYQAPAPRPSRRHPPATLRNR